MDANGFVRCGHGHRHWGRHGAAGLLLTDPERGVLLQRRAWWVHHGRTWAIPGGAVEAGEHPRDTAIREAWEEAEIPADALNLACQSTVDHGNWRYTTVLATVTKPVNERVANSESSELAWVPPPKVTDYRLHKDFALAWPSLHSQVGRELVLIVDGANVVGSRPDGWWRDRHGAAVRLRDKLARLAVSGISAADAGLPMDGDWTWWPRVILVVEGQARGVERVDEVAVVAAPSDGDSKIVEVARESVTSRPQDHVVVVTADRELKARVTAEGASVLGPGALLALLGRGS
ncbi:ADP-ribose pyrophosphatase YjhB, NUDIX family [Amycolatopsis xylanica]|uniref:ADP-ribose pyrophosphatase YjhB, NUDIX family n=1 Tax=Amycolatopsis xylanica TaxID=589385 RepID=A0A1H3Q183_9PSEU|nr:NUDIX hydrolase [Amycolatopsis xylanica]SDZ06878.1 ADP-ribose pyrophosphatase YjhB, NUDIX family [Amycolatopsis xylanica]